MFREMRFQTGEVREVAEAMKKGSIPCLEVECMDEFIIFANRLSEYGISQVAEIPYDKTARDRIKEPEFEFRAAFREQPSSSAESHTAKLMYMDVYYEKDMEEDYDSVGEIMF